MHQPGGPPPAPDNHYPGRVRRRWVSSESSHAGDERIRIPAPVGMVRPDELPAPPLSFVHLHPPLPCIDSGKIPLPRTVTVCAFQAGGAPRRRLDGAGQGDADDVIRTAAAGQVVHRSGEPL
jgi:hypothetical protein